MFQDYYYIYIIYSSQYELYTFRAFAIWQIFDDGGRSVRIRSWQPLDAVMPAAAADPCAATIF